MEAIRDVAWAVSRDRSEAGEDYRELVEHMSRAWRGLFPRQLGYATWVESPSAELVRLNVRRGDFRGSVDLSCRAGRGEVAKIQALAQAEPESLRVVRVSEARTLRQSQVIATCVGGALALVSCWWVAGFAMPVIGALMQLVVIVYLLVAGNNLGLRVGEWLVAARRERAEQAVHADPEVQADIVRWEDMSRKLRSYRRELVPIEQPEQPELGEPALVLDSSAALEWEECERAATGVRLYAARKGHFEVELPRCAEARSGSSELPVVVVVRAHVLQLSFAGDHRGSQDAAAMRDALLPLMFDYEPDVVLLDLSGLRSDDAEGLERVVSFIEGLGEDESIYVVLLGGPRSLGSLRTQFVNVHGRRAEAIEQAKLLAHARTLRRCACSLAPDAC